MLILDGGYAFNRKLGRAGGLRRPDAAARVSTLGARMKLAMHSLQPLLIDVGVDLCRRYVGVTQHLLDDSQIRAVA